MKLAIAILFCAGFAFMALSADLSSPPDERDCPRTIRWPQFPPVPTAKSSAPKTVIQLSGADFIFPAQVLPPVMTLNFSWPASADTNVAGYVLQWSSEINGNYATFARMTGTNLTATIPENAAWHGFIRVLAVNADGLNTEGVYETF